MTCQRAPYIYRQTGWETPLSKPLFEPAVPPVENESGIGDQQSPKRVVHPSDLGLSAGCAGGVPLGGRSEGRWGIGCTTHGVRWSLRMRDNQRGEENFWVVRVRAARGAGGSMHESGHSGTLAPAPGPMSLGVTLSTPSVFLRRVGAGDSNDGDRIVTACAGKFLYPA